MKPLATILLLMLMGTTCASAQFAMVPGSARSSALGGIHEPDTAMRRVMIGHRQEYGVEGMATRMVEACWALGQRGRAEVAYSHFGDRIYHEQQATAGYGMRLSTGLSASVRGRYLRMATGDAHYEARQWLATEATLMASVGEWLTLYAEGGSRPWDVDKPWMGRVGVAYRAEVGLTTSVELDSDDRTRLRAGVEYCYRGHYHVRAGMATAPLVLACGLGARMGIVGIDLAVESHEYLGLTPQISIALCF